MVCRYTGGSGDGKSSQGWSNNSGYGWLGQGRGHGGGEGAAPGWTPSIMQQQ